MNYYEETLQQIEQAIAQHRYEEASFLLNQELRMPYIPREIETKLKSFQKELLFYKNDGKEKGEESLDGLLHKLKGKPQSQLLACQALCDRNLRECIPYLQDYLSKDPFPQAAALLMEGLAEQEIDAEFTYQKDGVEYTFFGDAITPLTRSAGFLKALDLCEKEYLHEPAKKEMLKTVLIQKAYMALPLSIEEEESQVMIQQCKQQVEDCF